VVYSYNGRRGPYWVMGILSDIVDAGFVPRMTTGTGSHCSGERPKALFLLLNFGVGSDAT
jgi:hypothetical protein